jgi:hypothetical protein
MTGRTRTLQTISGIAIVMVSCASAAPSADAHTKSATVEAHRRQFTVRPSHLRVDQAVTFAGTGCPHRDVVLAGVSVTSTTSGTSVEVTPAADGSWHAMVAVGDSTMLGPSPAAAECVLAATHAVVFSYPTVPVRVTTFRRIEVAPGTSATPGATLTVTPSGSCPVNSGDAFAAIIDRGSYPGQGDGIGPGAAKFVRLRRQNNWSARITVPAGTAPGHYEVTAYCTSSRSFTAWYPVVPITVTG